MRQKLRNPEWRKDLEIFLPPQRTSVRLKKDNPESVPGIDKKKNTVKNKTWSKVLLHCFFCRKKQKGTTLPRLKKCTKTKIIPPQKDLTKCTSVVIIKVEKIKRIKKKGVRKMTRYNNYKNHDRFGVGNHKRECFRTKGNQFFEKTFNDENYCKNYLNKVKANAKYPFYYKVENNENGTQTLRLFKVQTWYE